jgi:hypothetical protein
MEVMAAFHTGSRVYRTVAELERDASSSWANTLLLMKIHGARGSSFAEDGKGQQFVYFP